MFGVAAAASSNIPQIDSNIVKKKSEERKSVTICSKCHQIRGKGISHPNICTIVSSSNNIAGQVCKLPDQQQEQVVSNLLFNKASKQTGKK